ncbi:MAG TPA: AMP-binding protein [bacterium]|nr:AMP-binding protein [bacterium]
MNVQAVTDPRQESNNVVFCLKEKAANSPDTPAMIMPSETITFGELWARVDRFGTGIERAGICPGDRLICMIPMSADLYIVILGILKIGAVAVFVDPWIGMKSIARFASYAEPVGFFGIPKSHFLRLLNIKLAMLPVTLTTGTALWSLPAKYSLKAMLKYSGDGRIAPVQPADTALITFTSGSSGTPKGVNRTHGFLLAQHQALKTEFPCHHDDVDMSMFPVFVLNNLGLGIPTVVPAMDFKRAASVSGERVCRQMQRCNVTTCTASPPFIQNLAEYLDESKEPLKLRRILTGGAPVSDTRLRFWRSTFRHTEICVVYGSTEAEPVAHIDADKRLTLTKRDSTIQGYCAGKPCRQIRARLVPINRNFVDSPVEFPRMSFPPGTVGELIVSGDHVCRDYFRNPEAVAVNKLTDQNGAVWHRMGDTGYFDSDGYFWITGRVHSTIFRDSLPVHAQLIEQAVSRDGIDQVAAVGIPHPDLGEEVIVVIRSESLVDKATVRAALTAAGLTADRIIQTRVPLPVDPRHNAKIDYSKLRELILRGKIHE